MANRQATQRPCIAGGGRRGGGEEAVTRGGEVALLQVHGAVEECNEGGHQEAGEVVGRAPPVHHRPLLHQLKHLHHSLTCTMMSCLEFAGKAYPGVPCLWKLKNPYSAAA